MRAAWGEGIIGAVTSGLSYDGLLLLLKILLSHPLFLLKLLLLQRHLLPHVLFLLLLLLLLLHHLCVKGLSGISWGDS